MEKIAATRTKMETRYPTSPKLSKGRNLSKRTRQSPTAAALSILTKSSFKDLEATTKLITDSPKELNTNRKPIRTTPKAKM